MLAATTPRNRLGLRIDGGAEAVLEIARISLQQQHFVDLADEVEADSTKILSYESNTSSSSSEGEGEDGDGEPSDRRASFRNKNKVFLAKISLQDGGGGVDSMPFTPNSKHVSQDLISPFLDDEDVARALQQQQQSAAGKKLATGTKRPLTIDLSKPRAVPVSAPAPVPAANGKEDDFALERRELQSRARRAEKRLAFALMDSALRRRKNLLLRLFLRRWRLAASMAPNLHRAEAPNGDSDDAQVLANQLLKRLRELRS